MSPNLLKELETKKDNETLESKDDSQLNIKNDELNDFFVRENILKNEPLYAPVEKNISKEPEIKPLNLFSASAFEQDSSPRENILSKKQEEIRVEEEPPQTEIPQVEADDVENVAVEPETVENNDDIVENEQFFEIKPKKKKKISQFRLKLFSVLFCIGMAACTGWVITNFVRISNVNKAIESVQTEHSANVIKLKNNIEKLDDLSNPEENSDLEKVEKIITVTPLPLEDPTDYQETTNWFNELCDWISGLFGG